MKPRKPLDAAETTRLIKILGMTQSSHDGERLNALSLATEMLVDHGLLWKDVIPVPSTERANHQEQPREAERECERERAWREHERREQERREQERREQERRERERREQEQRTRRDQAWRGDGFDNGIGWWRSHWREYLHWCRDALAAGALSAWEADFVETMLDWDGTPTDRQLQSYAKLVRRLEGMIHEYEARGGA